MSDFVLFTAEFQHWDRCPDMVLNNCLLNEPVDGWQMDWSSGSQSSVPNSSPSITWELGGKANSQALLEIYPIRSSGVVAHAL